MGIDLYSKAGLDIYERTRYFRDEHIEEVRQILTWLPADMGRVFDVGCSGGRHALEFGRKGFSVIGVDIEPFAVERAKGRARRDRLPARFRVLDITRDDLSALGPFDFISSLGNILSYINKPEVPGVLKKVRAGHPRRGEIAQGDGPSRQRRNTQQEQGRPVGPPNRDGQPPGGLFLTRATRPPYHLAVFANTDSHLH